MITETAKPNNRLLSALSTKAYRQLLPKTERIALEFAGTIYNSGDVIHHLYFPDSGIISLLSAVEANSTIEVGIVGNEGIVGLPVFLGVKTSINRAVVQGVGFALKISSEDFLDECKNGELPKILQRFTHSLMTQISQSAACNRFHEIEPRLARWLLMTADRMQSDEFQITQEFLSNMLGVRREAVNKAATNFQQKQLISYSRGNISILDHQGLKESACSCYQIIKRDYDNFLN
ncbi:MAG: Crp/Fnr family transcriptional regulator [Actinomycetota bacterium]